MKSNVLIQSKRASLTQTTLFLVLSAETALFGTLVMSYLFLRSGGSESVFTHPRPVDVMIASLNTLMLLVSAVFARNAQRAISQGQLKRLQTCLLLPLLLGALFFAGQVFEFRHSGMRIDVSTFGAIFFALISFHALHVLAGMTVLGLNYARARLGDFRADRHVAITAGAWFWYYVVGVWIVLFTVLYLV
jgi:heme/copper-type cytochrome/quinol oxidase subunit 3